MFKKHQIDYKKSYDQHVWNNKLNKNYFFYLSLKNFRIRTKNVKILTVSLMIYVREKCRLDTTNM